MVCASFLWRLGQANILCLVTRIVYDVLCAVRICVFAAVMLCYFLESTGCYERLLRGGGRKSMEFNLWCAIRLR